MTLTLLLDLDDTLVDNDQNVFFAAFVSTFVSTLARHAAPERLLRGMQRGVRAMLLNDDPALTLGEAFYREFLGQVPPADVTALQADIETYYQEVYPSLAAYTRVRPQAVALVDWAFSQGYRVAVATNPLFTTSAVEQRLEWAGLPPEKYPFALVTANETFHFAKSPAYYGEVMARLGWPDGPVLMVGDDLHLDVSSARAAGLAAFQVLSPRTDGSAGVANGTGGIEDVRPWLESANESQLRLSTDSPQAIMATLRSTPAGLAGLVAALPAHQWPAGQRGEEWGLTEICCHLRDVDAEVNLPRFSAVLEENNPFIAAQETDNWAAQRSYAQQDGREALRTFARHRRALLAKLADIAPDGWGRRARHSIFGPTDLLELTAISAEHDRSHVRQAFAVLAELANCCA